jgi:hypothetical protein
MMNLSEKIHGALIDRMTSKYSKVTDSDLKVWYDESTQLAATNADLLEALEWLVDDCKLVAQGRKDNVPFTHITKALEAIRKAKEQ